MLPRLLLPVLFCAVAGAQSVSITLNVTVASGSPNEGGVATFSGQGTLTPFGPVYVSGTIDLGATPGFGGNVAVIMNLSDIGVGGSFANGTEPSFTAYCANAAYSSNAGTTISTASGTLDFSNGTNQFSGPSGSMQFTMTFDANNQGSVVITGSGTITSYTLQQIINQQALGSPVMSIFSQVNGQGPKPAVQTTIGLWNGTQAVNFNTNVTTPTFPNAKWLTVSPSSGSIGAGAQSAVTATSNGAGMQAGVYQGTIQINSSTISNTGSQGLATPETTAASANSLAIPVTMVVTNADQLVLSPQGLTFWAADQYANPLVNTLLAQPVTISGSGVLPLNISTSATTASGGNWLSVNQSSATVTSTNSASLTIQANPAGLADGVYFGQVAFSSPDASNSPQSVQVALTVLPSSNTSDLSAPTVFTPAGLVFAGLVGTAPPAQTVALATPDFVPVVVNTSTTQGVPFFMVNATGGTSLAVAQPLSYKVSITTTSLSAGVYGGTITFQVGESTYLIPVTLILDATAPTAAISGAPAASTSCAPTQLIPVFTSIPGGFQFTASLPVPLQALIYDDCGSPFTAGQALVSFSSNDPAVLLNPVGNGAWSGTWFPHNVPSGGTMSVGLAANSMTSTVAGSVSVSGTVTANSAIPAIDPGGAVNAASLTLNGPIAPGAFISIFGENFASASTTLPSPYVPGTAGGVQVTLAGEGLPIQFVGQKQINAIVPYDMPVNQLQSLTVTSNGQVSAPQQVILAAAQPAVFTQNGSGAGPGAIEAIGSSGVPFLVTSTTPATAGDALVIYCTGLGAVTPPVAAGTIAPTSPLSTVVSPVTVTVGGQSAQVLFAGLAPGFSGLYQINAIVPAGITAGSSVPVVVTTSGMSSPVVTVAIQ